MQKAEQDLKLAKQELDAAQKLYDGRQSLYAQGAVSAKDVDDARTLLIQARNQYDLAQKQFDLKVAEGQLTAAKGKTASAEAQLSYTKIVSPIDGVVTDRPVYPGEMAAAGAPILTVMNLSQVIARAHIAQQEAAQLKVGDPATISVPGQGGDVKGKVTLVSPALDPNSTTVEVWVQAPNPGDRLKPGTSVRVAIVAQTVPHAIVVPGGGLADRPGRSHLGDRPGHRQQAAQAKGEGRHSQWRRRADHRGSARRRARGHRGSLRARQEDDPDLSQRRRFRCRRRRCRKRTTRINELRATRRPRLPGGSPWAS